MGCWNFGCSMTLNTFALGLFVREAVPHGEKEFLEQLAREYFGPVDQERILTAWEAFCKSFEQFPFSIPMLYWSVMNYAPAFALSSTYQAKPLAPSWMKTQPSEWGDRLEDCYGPFTLDEIISGFEVMVELWDAGLAKYRAALSRKAMETEQQACHRIEELSCANMIGCHLRCSLGVFRFHRWRLAAMARLGLLPPCRTPLDDQARAIIQAQITHCKETLPLVEQDRRLGFHQEAQAWLYDAERIRAAISQMEQELRK